MRLSLPRRIAMQQLGAALLLPLVIGLGPSGSASAEEAGSWRFYRNATPAFTVLYPQTLSARHVGKRLGADTMLVEEWRLPEGAGDIQLTVTDRPAGGSVADWIKSQVGGNAVPIDIASMRGATVESLSDGVYAIAIYLDETTSGKVIGFTLSMRNVPPGTTLAQAKSRYRPRATDFWRMVESIKIGG